MSQTSIKLKLRTSTHPDKPRSLYIQLIKNRKIRTITTPHRVYKNEWNEKSQSIISDSASSSRSVYLGRVTRFINNEIPSLRSIVRDMDNIGEYSIDQVMEFLHNQQTGGLLSVYVTKLKTQLEKRGQHRTARGYQSVVNNFIRFNEGKDIHLGKITSVHTLGFEAYMKEKGNSLNTISFYLRNLRAIINKAIREKILENKGERLFENLFVGVAKTRKRAVGEDVIRTLSEMEIDGKKREPLSFARDMFLLSFYLRGISYIDLAHLKKTDFKNQSIHYTRSKTGQLLEIAVTPEITNIIRRYEPLVENSVYLLPILFFKNKVRSYENALRRQNSCLRVISRKIALEVPLTSYVARHAWATIARDQGVPLSIISQGLGHESEKTTLIYLGLLDYSILHKANTQVINCVMNKR